MDWTPFLYQALEKALQMENKSDGAMAAFKRALRLRPDDYSSHQNIGNLLLEKGDTEGAVAELRAALNGTIAEYGSVLSSVESATEVYVKRMYGLQLYSLHYNLGWALFMNGDRDEGVAEVCRGKSRPVWCGR